MFNFVVFEDLFGETALVEVLELLVDGYDLIIFIVNIRIIIIILGKEIVLLDLLGRVLFLEEHTFAVNFVLELLLEIVYMVLGVFLRVSSFGGHMGESLVIFGVIFLLLLL